MPGPPLPSELAGRPVYDGHGVQHTEADEECLVVWSGKVVGPAMAGVLITWVEYSMTFVIMGLILLAGAAAIWRHSWTANRRKMRSDVVPGHAGLYD